MSFVLQLRLPLIGPLEDEDVLAEKAAAGATGPSSVSLLLRNVHRFYSYYGDHIHAVNDVSFRVDGNVCFGLLGVNGAGENLFGVIFARFQAKSLTSVVDGSVSQSAASPR